MCLDGGFVAHSKEVPNTIFELLTNSWSVGGEEVDEAHKGEDVEVATASTASSFSSNSSYKGCRKIRPNLEADSYERQASVAKSKV